jgi:hypothetical protein
MRFYPEINIWELVFGTLCFGFHCILRGQNPLTAWYLGPNTSSLAVKVPNLAPEGNLDKCDRGARTTTRHDILIGPKR